MIVVFRSSNPAFLLVGAVVMVVALVGGIGMALSRRGGAGRQRRIQRENYLDYLEKFRARMRDRGRALRGAALFLDPGPEALLDLVRDPARLWERRPSHPDFLTVRVGLGDETRFPADGPAGTGPGPPVRPDPAGRGRRDGRPVRGRPRHPDHRTAGRCRSGRAHRRPRRRPGRGPLAAAAAGHPARTRGRRARRRLPGVGRRGLARGRPAPAPDRRRGPPGRAVRRHPRPAARARPGRAQPPCDEPARLARPVR